MSWIIGTAVLWVLKLITMPFAKLLAGDRVKRVVTPASAPAPDVVEPSEPEAQPVPAPAVPA